MLKEKQIHTDNNTIFHVKDVLTAEELAKRLNISVDYISKHAPIMVGFFKIGGQVRFDWSEISVAIKQKKNLIQKMRRSA